MVEVGTIRLEKKANPPPGSHEQHGQKKLQSWTIRSFADSHLPTLADEQTWMVAFHNRPETETGHPLPGFLDDQRLRAVVGHVEPNALVLTDLGNLDRGGDENTAECRG